MTPQSPSFTFRHCKELDTTWGLNNNDNNLRAWVGAMPFHVPGRNLRLWNQSGLSEDGGVSGMGQVDSAADLQVGWAARTLGKD